MSTKVSDPLQEAPVTQDATIDQSAYAAGVRKISKYDVVEATVVGLTDREAIVDVRGKADGIVPLSEFRDMPELDLGSKVEVYVENPEDRKGQMLVSRKKAKLVRVWEQIQQALEDRSMLESLVKRRTKGGLIVDLLGVEAFLPGSQIDVKPVRDFDVFVGKKIDVAVIKINSLNNNVVVSHKALIEKSLESQRAEIISNLEKGQILEGTVKNLTSFGAFVDLGGVDGLLHITDISWGRVAKPEDVLEIGQVVKVVVTDFDEEKKRISLGMKQLSAHPWDAMSEGIAVGAKIKGKVTNVTDYGAFVEVAPGVEGLVHVSEVSWSQYPKSIHELLKVGEEIEAVVLGIDREEKRMSLGIKQLQGNPWEQPGLSARYAVGSRQKGQVRNLTNFGAFIELEDGIDGLLHVSDFSWTRKVAHPSEMLKAGQEVEAVVLEIDLENHRISLGIKQLEEDPWDEMAQVFVLGSVHRAAVLKKVDRGGILELAYGVEGFAPRRTLVKEDGSEAEVGEVLDFQVIEFDRGEHRVVLSHLATYAPEQEAKAQASKASKQNYGGASERKSIVTSEKTTMGDLEVLASLKEQLSEAKPTKKKAKAVEPAKEQE